MTEFLHNTEEIGQNDKFQLSIALLKVVGYISILFGGNSFFNIYIYFHEFISLTLELIGFISRLECNLISNMLGYNTKS